MRRINASLLLLIIWVLPHTRVSAGSRDFTKIVDQRECDETPDFPRALTNWFNEYCLNNYSPNKRFEVCATASPSVKLLLPEGWLSEGYGVYLVKEDEILNMSPLAMERKDSCGLSEPTIRNIADRNNDGNPEFEIGCEIMYGSHRDLDPVGQGEVIGATWIYEWNGKAIILKKFTPRVE